MAYNADNDIKEVIETVDKNLRGDKVRVTKITSKKTDVLKVDIREMYTDGNNELQYGKAGIRIGSEMAADIIVAMLKALGQDTIQDVLTRIEEI